MSRKPAHLTAAVLVFAVICAITEVGLCRASGKVGSDISSCGGPDIRDSDEVQSLARFALEEHTKNSNALLEFGKVLKAKEQVVAGKIYHLTLVVTEAGKKTVYEAKVWVKPWMNFKHLLEFKRAVDATASGLVDLRERFGWHRVHVYDPEVQDAADHAVRLINQRLNCICKYRLLEVLTAEAEVVKDYVNYNLTLNLRMGSKDEAMKVKVHKAANGFFFSDPFGQHDMQ